MPRGGSDEQLRARFRRLSPTLQGAIKTLRVEIETMPSGPALQTLELVDRTLAEVWLGKVRKGDG